MEIDTDHAWLLKGKRLESRTRMLQVNPLFRSLPDSIEKLCIEMQTLLSEIQTVRPLLEYERKCRMNALEFPLRLVVEYEFHRVFQNHRKHSLQNHKKDIQVEDERTTCEGKDSCIVEGNKQKNGLMKNRKTHLGKKYASKKSLPVIGRVMMQRWFDKNKNHPYPSPEEKMRFIFEGGLSPMQVEYWFINTRAKLRRTLQ
jgi:hypothetical protein